LAMVDGRWSMVGGRLLFILCTDAFRSLLFSVSYVQRADQLFQYDPSQPTRLKSDDDLYSRTLGMLRDAINNARIMHKDRKP
jgi:hypothetical protein